MVIYRIPKRSSLPHPLPFRTVLFVLVIVGLKLRALDVLGRCSPTEL